MSIPEAPRSSCPQGTCSPSQFPDEDSYLRARFRQRRQRLLDRRGQQQQQAQTHQSPRTYLGRQSPSRQQQYISQQQQQQQSPPRTPRASRSPCQGRCRSVSPPWSPSNQSPLRRFDRAVTEILRKRLAESTAHSYWTARPQSVAMGPEPPGPGATGSQAASSRLALDHTLEELAGAGSPSALREAADRLAMATFACRYQGAVNAAEAAARGASSPREAEEAAAASARGYTTRIVDQFDEMVPEDLQNPGLYRPVQVIGYIGLTRPK